jgi:hypothetical protein
MNEQMKVQVSTTLRNAVVNVLQSTGDGRSLAQVVEVALKAWLAGVAVADPKAAVAANRGYQWKSLFLPEGTLLRIALGGRYTVAAVNGDHIVFQGHTYSPRQFVIHVTGQVRNAWLALWIRCPGDARWHLADTRRRILRRYRQDAAAPRSTPKRMSTPAPAPVLVPVPTSTSTSPSPTSTPPPSPTSTPSPLSVAPHMILRAHRRQSYLRRDDCVRDDQADLSIRLPAGRGAGPYGAGRAGPPDRRVLGSLFYPGRVAALPGPSAVFDAGRC